MTIEKLLSVSASEIESLSDKELEDFFKPFFQVTRPDPSKVKEIRTENKNKSDKRQMDRAYDKALSMARKLGIDV